MISLKADVMKLDNKVSCLFVCLFFFLQEVTILKLMVFAVLNLLNFSALEVLTFTDLTLNDSLNELPPAKLFG